MSTIHRDKPSVGLVCLCRAATPDEPLEGDGTTRQDWEAADERCAAKALAEGWRKINGEWRCAACAMVATMDHREVVQA